MAQGWKGWSLAFIAAWFVGVAAIPAQATLTSDQFVGWFNQGYQGKLQISKEAKAAARSYEYVFVAGFFNEVVPTYFSQNIQALVWLGVPRYQIHVLFPSSFQDFEHNKEVVRQELENIAEESGKKIVVVGHSRGACDALAIAIEQPQWAHDHIAWMFLLNGPFGGSPLADYAMGNAPEPGNEMKPWARFFASLIGDVEKEFLQEYIQPAVAGLTREKSKAFWKQLLADHADAVSLLGDRIFYVRAHEKATMQDARFYPTTEYLDTYFGPNDGVVLFDDQRLKEIGTTIVDVSGNHHALIRSSSKPFKQANFRYALMESIVMSLDEARAEAPKKLELAGQ